MAPKDWNNKEISEGNTVTFGEKHTKGKVLGFEEKDGRVRIEVIEYIGGQRGDKPWRYVFLVPPGQVRIEQTTIKQEEKGELELDIEVEEPISLITSTDK
jgi:hypothetical protein